MVDGRWNIGLSTAYPLHATYHLPLSLFVSFVSSWFISPAPSVSSVPPW